MGADFVYSILPLCEKTDGRVAELKKLIEDATLDDYGKIMPPWQGFCDEGDFNDCKDDILAALDEYWDLQYRRDVGLLCLDPRGITCILTGGMSYGDSPTDAYLVFEKLEGLWDYFEKYAKEDLSHA